MKIVFRVAEDLKSNSISQTDDAETSESESLPPPQIDSWFPKHSSPSDSDPYHYPLTEVERAESEAEVFGGSVFRREKSRSNPQKEASRMHSSANSIGDSLNFLIAAIVISFPLFV
jgi:hypothetical protein